MAAQKKVLITLFLCGFIVFWGAQAMGDDWTAEQNEVWAVVQASWENIKKGDVNGISAGQHDKMLVWFSAHPDPLRKELIQVYYKTWIDRYVPTFIKLEPVAINIVKDVATVFYLFKWESANKELSNRGRELITLVKQNNRWLAIGSLASSCDNRSPCPYNW